MSEAAGMDFEFSAGESKGGGGFSDSGVRGNVYVCFAGYSRRQDGTLVISTKFDTYGHEVAQDGSVWRKKRWTTVSKDTSGAVSRNGKWQIEEPAEKLKPVPGTEIIEEMYPGAHRTQIIWNFKVISPVEHRGKILPLGTTMKGIEFPKPNSLNFVTSMGKRSFGQIANLVRFSQMCGLRIESGFNSASATFDPTYALPLARQMTPPFDYEQVLTMVIEPLLLQHAEARVLLFGETSDKSHWLRTSTVTAVGPQDAAIIWKAYDAAEEVPLEPEEEVPMPSQADVDASADASKWRGEIRSAAGAGRVTSDEIVAQLTEADRLPSTEEPLLDALSSEVLKAVVDWIDDRSKSVKDRLTVVAL